MLIDFACRVAPATGGISSFLSQQSGAAPSKFLDLLLRVFGTAYLFMNPGEIAQL